MEIKVSALVVAYLLNDHLKQLTRECIDSLKGYDELIIIDNGSPVEDDYLKEKADIYVHFKENKGLVKAINRGMFLSTSNHMVFISNDTRLIKGDLLELCKLCEYHQVVSPHIVNADGMISDEHHGVVYAIPLVDRKFILDEQFFIYFADTDMFQRVDKVSTEEIEFFHHHNQTGKTTGERKTVYEEDHKKFIEKNGYDPEE